ncbi:hypothetical protein Scep_026430 [Stephania cephalantha]|uniref:Uncharacterized protein n=1 Tax=Stephania cephalantha TaxID=152367 RepID=A0AAP0EK59_9MAGN
MPHLSFLLIQSRRLRVRRGQTARASEMVRYSDEQRRGFRVRRGDGNGFGGSNLRQTATADPTASSQSQSQRRQRFQGSVERFGERGGELTVSAISVRERERFR